MSYHIINRTVLSDTVIFGQLDFFQSDSFTRVTGLTPTNISVTVYLNNVNQSWTMISGVAVSDTQVAAGYIYFEEVDAGVYSVRFRPNATGFWRIQYAYTAGAQLVLQSYDVMAQLPLTAIGLTASFV